MPTPLFDAPEPAADVASVAARPICGGKRWIEIPARGQGSFLVRCVDDLVPHDSLVRVVDEIGNHLDFSGIEHANPGGGRPAFHPRLVGTIVVYGMCVGVLSARELSQRLEYDTRFMWLAHEQHIDHEVFSDFRRRFGPQIKDLFKETVRLALQLGLVSLAHVAIDGTKIAAAAQRRALNKDDLDQAIAKLDERIEKLLAEAEALDTADEAELGHLRGDEVSQELATVQARREKLGALLPQANEDPHKPVSPTDPEAPLQKTQDGKRPGYNAQIAVDEKVGIIVAADVTSEQNDTQQFEPMAEQTIANVQQTPKVIATDTGYHSGEALEYLERKPELNAYIKQQPPDTPGLYGHEDFAYDEQSDSYLCPAGQRLVSKGLKKLRGKENRWYRAEHTCAHCERRGQCFNGKMPYRELIVAPHGLLAVAMKRRLKSDQGQQALQTRKQTVERTFGTTKARLGLRQFLTRGLANAQTQFSLAALAVNVRKLAAWIQMNGWTPAPARASG
jgi:transposase